MPAPARCKGGVTCCVAFLRGDFCTNTFADKQTQKPNKKKKPGGSFLPAYERAGCRAALSKALGKRSRAARQDRSAARTCPGPGKATREAAAEPLLPLLPSGSAVPRGGRSRTGAPRWPQPWQTPRASACRAGQPPEMPRVPPGHVPASPGSGGSSRPCSARRRRSCGGGRAGRSPPPSRQPRRAGAPGCIAARFWAAAASSPGCPSLSRTGWACAAASAAAAPGGLRSPPRTPVPLLAGAHLLPPSLAPLPRLSPGRCCPDGVPRAPFEFKPRSSAGFCLLSPCQATPAASRRLLPASPSLPSEFLTRE